jgi:hypothetical protein
MLQKQNENQPLHNRNQTPQDSSSLRTSNQEDQFKKDLQEKQKG